MIRDGQRPAGLGCHSPVGGGAHGGPADRTAGHLPAAGTSTPLQVGATPLGHGAQASAL